MENDKIFLDEVTCPRIMQSMEKSMDLIDQAYSALASAAQECAPGWKGDARVAFDRRFAKIGDCRASFKSTRQEAMAIWSHAMRCVNDLSGIDFCN